jgi:cytochrome c oxidase cbb3-type subunit 3
LRPGLVATLGALAAFAFGVGACSNDAGPAIPIDPAVMYAQNCARCHGADGHGNAEIKKTLPTVRDFSDPTFLATAQPDTVVRTIMAGKGQMPAFGASLSLPKMQSLSGYVLRLGHGQVH